MNAARCFWVGGAFTKQTKKSDTRTLPALVLTGTGQTGADRRAEGVRGIHRVMPSLRHSYTLSGLEEPNRHRKSPMSRSKLVSAVMGLIVNQAKVSPVELGERSSLRCDTFALQIPSKILAAPAPP